MRSRREARHVEAPMVALDGSVGLVFADQQAVSRFARRWCDSTTKFRKQELGAHGTCPAMSRLDPGKTTVQ